MATIALGLEYDGGDFNGWQRQSHRPSVQSALEAALSQVAAVPVRTVAAGRTDAGVHATGQVASFQCDTPRPLRAWRDGVNALTPVGVKVRWAREVDDGFHARFSAIARRYLYLYRTDALPSPLRGRRCWGVGPLASVAPSAKTDAMLKLAAAGRGGSVGAMGGLDAAAMHQAGQALLGEHDFTSFRAAGCQSRTPSRCVHRLRVQAIGDLVVLDIVANAFLLRMVRNIAGALLQVGRGERSPAWLGECLRARDRTLIGRTAPPYGLYLVDVRYPHHDLPSGALPPLLAALGGLHRLPE